MYKQKPSRSSGSPLGKFLVLKFCHSYCTCSCKLYIHVYPELCSARVTLTVHVHALPLPCREILYWFLTSVWELRMASIPNSQTNCDTWLVVSDVCSLRLLKFPQQWMVTCYLTISHLCPQQFPCFDWLAKNTHGTWTAITVAVMKSKELRRRWQDLVYKILLCKLVIKNLFWMCHFIVRNRWTVNIRVPVTGKTMDKPGWTVGKPRTFKPWPTRCVNVHILWIVCQVIIKNLYECLITRNVTS